MRTLSEMGASCLPSALTWINAQARPQYSYDVFEKKIFGTTFSAVARSSRPPVSPVTGSFSGRSVKGKMSVGKKIEEVGWASREGWAKR